MMFSCGAMFCLSMLSRSWGGNHLKSQLATNCSSPHWDTHHIYISNDIFPQLFFQLPHSFSWPPPCSQHIFLLLAWKCRPFHLYHRSFYIPQAGFESVFPKSSIRSLKWDIKTKLEKHSNALFEGVCMRLIWHNMFMTVVMLWFWRGHIALMHTPSNKVVPKVFFSPDSDDALLQNFFALYRQP